MKLKKISILVSFLALWLTSYLSEIKQFFVGFILILSFGILHGANDLMIINKIKVKKLTKNNFEVTLYYILIVLISALLFYFIPFITLVLFILVSGLHFGEQQWSGLLENNNLYIKTIFQILYGIQILSLLFFFHSIQVTDIVFSITQVKVDSLVFSLLLGINSFLLIVFSLYLYNKDAYFKKNYVEELIYLIVLTIIFKVSSLIWGFTIYFIVWHSIPSLNDQVTFLYGSNSIQNFINYFKNAFVYWFMALSGLGLFYYMYNENKLFEALFFSFLAAITFPHALVILNMFQKKTELN